MQEVPEIDIHAANELLERESAVFVDIRDPASHAAAHIPGCRHLTSEADVDALCAEFGPDSPVVVYCYHGNASKGATAYLAEKGLTGARSLSGGFELWRQSYRISP